MSNALVADLGLSVLAVAEKYHVAIKKVKALMYLLRAQGR